MNFDRISGLRRALGEHYWSPREKRSVRAHTEAWSLSLGDFEPKMPKRPRCFPFNTFWGSGFVVYKSFMPARSKISKQLQTARALKLVGAYIKKISSKTHIELRSELLQKLIKNRTTPNILFLDVDGTIVNFRKRFWEEIRPRPNLRYFLRRVSKKFDIVLYSRSDAAHVEFVREMWCRPYVRYSMSREFSSGDIKYCDEFLGHGLMVLIVDDNPDSFCLSHRSSLIKIKKWTKDHAKDSELVSMADKLFALAPDHVQNQNK